MLGLAYLGGTFLYIYKPMPRTRRCSRRTVAALRCVQYGNDAGAGDVFTPGPAAPRCIFFRGWEKQTGLPTLTHSSVGSPLLSGVQVEHEASLV